MGKIYAVVMVIFIAAALQNHSVITMAIPQESSLSSQARTIDRYLKSLHFNGTALVVKNNEILLNKGYGYGNVETRKENKPTTAFYIASLTKVMVATAIMQLHDQRKLDITEPVSKYIPDFPRGGSISLQHLLTQTSGIPGLFQTGEKMSRTKLMRVIAKRKLKFEPGTDWHYSDSNYTLLALILEKVTNEKLQTYFERHIFQPAGMNHSGFGGEVDYEAVVARGYKRHVNHLMPTSLPDMSQLLGCGDVITTAYDMYLFDKALFLGRLLSKNRLNQLLTPMQHHYAMGMYSNSKTYSNHGVLPGFNTYNSISKDGQIITVLFSNIQNTEIGKINEHIYAILEKE